MSFCLPRCRVVAPSECHRAVVHAHKPGIGDGDAMGVSGEIGQYLLRSAEGWFGVDHPLDTAALGNCTSEGWQLCQAGKVAEEVEFPCVKGRLQFLQEQPPEQARQNPHGAGRNRVGRRPSVFRHTMARHLARCSAHADDSAGFAPSYGEPP